jgi:uncharacterized protein (DUF1800 family)
MTESQKIKHLFSRAGFGFTPEEWERRRSVSVEQAVDHLFQKAAQAEPIYSYNSMADLNEKKAKNRSQAQKKKRREKEKGLMIKQNAKWVARMTDPAESALLERMSLFWHDHFACITKFGHLAATQLNTIRTHALGKFEDLVLAIAHDVSMIRFLNNQQNKKEQPNENFARELLELFTIGRGNYTEQDIKEAARAFTGWSSNLKGEFVFRKFQHDFGSKTFMGKTGDFNGEDIISIVLEQKETARYITKKIYRYFVNDTVPAGRLESLAHQFYQSGYDIGELMRTIFTSDWFYSPENVGNKIKSPIDLMAGMLRQLRGKVQDNLALVVAQKALGQVLFNPPNVAGWPGGKSWIDNSVLLLRLNLVAFLFEAAEVNFQLKGEARSALSGKKLKKLDATLDLKPVYEFASGLNKQQTLDQLAEWLLPPNCSWNSSLIQEFTMQQSNEQYIKSLLLRIMSLPEYQLC